ncbi:MAG: CdaR family protein [Deltaproteobacteria bacterium]|nr:CdaR family protein [Deltaproteobacteria bacterium]MCL5277097.1 CdaR family protein [Deltaproteobacteria bacterium]
MKKLSRFITDNYVYKILSVLIAVFLWFFAQSEKTSTVTLKVPVIIDALPEGEVIVNDVPRYIELTLSGPSSEIFHYASGKPVYTINLLKTGVGNYIFSVSSSEFDIPDRLKIETVYPDSITVSLDRVVSRQVDVGVSIVGNPPPNTTLKGIVMEPDRVVITGPSTIISTINVVMTEPVDIGKFQDNIALMVPLSLTGYKMVTAQPQAIVVIFKMRQR